MFKGCHSFERMTALFFFLNLSGFMVDSLIVTIFGALASISEALSCVLEVKLLYYSKI